MITASFLFSFSPVLPTYAGEPKTGPAEAQLLLAAEGVPVAPKGQSSTESSKKTEQAPAAKEGVGASAGGAGAGAGTGGGISLGTIALIGAGVVGIAVLAIAAGGGGGGGGDGGSVAPSHAP